MNKELLTELYLTDPNFILNYHGLKDKSLEFCVNDTWETIKNAESYVYDFGYFTKDNTLDIVPRLTGFFIKPEFRNKETFDLFKNEVNSKMPKYFMSCTHKDNTKVNNFLTKLGGKQFHNIENNTYYFIFKQENI